ncbi:MAG TPA: SRPBCC family protein [Gemmatimonadota bacterium]|nr:SRPBCC family protein [Gemmatimonadota bacterium]
MRVYNLHQRVLPAPASRVGELIDRLAAQDDRLWPGDRWPPIRFDRALGVGAAGGHGPIRYTVEAYEPGHSVRFRFTGPPGLDGWHAFQLEDSGEGQALLRHLIDMDVRGQARFTWPVVFRPLHDALMEDLLDNAAACCGAELEAPRWSPWVRLLRRILRRRSGRRSRG